MGDPGHITGSGFQLDRCVGELDKGARSIHVPVLLGEVLDGLRVRPGGRYVDATVGGGGHATEILAALSPDGCLLGLDRDPDPLGAARARLTSYHAERFVLVHSSFTHLEEIAHARGFVPADGVLFDLGLSSLQLADPGRGFAFMTDGPLDMRFDPAAGGPTAADLVNQFAPQELADILCRYGDASRRQARRIVEAIVADRPLHTTQELVSVIKRAVGRRRRRIHPATLIFQALRIAVNDELAALETVLPQAVEILAPGGRLAVISFHSLEDRIVKHFVRRESRDCICPPGLPVCVCDHRATLRMITRKPVRPTEEEVSANPRSRSARLRIAEKR